VVHGSALIDSDDLPGYVDEEIPCDVQLTWHDTLELAADLADAYTQLLIRPPPSPPRRRARWSVHRGLASKSLIVASQVCRLG